MCIALIFKISLQLFAFFFFFFDGPYGDGTCGLWHPVTPEHIAHYIQQCYK